MINKIIWRKKISCNFKFSTQKKMMNEDKVNKEAEEVRTTRCIM